MAQDYDLSDLPVHIPEYFLKPPPLVDELETETSQVQQETIAECLPLLAAVANPVNSPLDFNDYGVPSLKRESHVAFLEQNLARFPAQFVGLDASRPWMVYWGLVGLYLLGEDVSVKRER